MINAIFAVNAIDGFGDGDTMPWPRSRIDLKRFKDITMGHTVVMGAKTWLSDMPKPLVGRRNIVLSTSLVDDRCEVYSSVNGVMMNVSQDEEVYVIGGATILWTLRPYIQRVYLTRHDAVQPATVLLHTERYLDGYTLAKREKIENIVFDIYDKT